LSLSSTLMLIPLNVPGFPARNRSKSSFRAMIMRAHGSLKRILWQDYVFLIADCVKCETSYERRQFLSTCLISDACREQTNITNTWMNAALLRDHPRHCDWKHYTINTIWTTNHGIGYLLPLQLYGKMVYLCIHAVEIV
jgi:hypothetical protein